MPQRERYLGTLRRESEALVAAVRPCLNVRVPKYPAWRGADLLIHVGTVQRWATDILRMRRQARPARPDMPRLDDADLLGWFARGARDLARCLEETDLATAVWTISADGTAAFWLRRMAHEASLHRWDADSMSGTPRAIPWNIAASGLAESLEIHVVRLLRGRWAGLGGSIALAPTDATEAWRLELTTAGPVVAAETGGVGLADATLRGSAGDLWLYVMDRPGEKLEVAGNTRLVRAFESLLHEVPDAARSGTTMRGGSQAS